METAAFFAGASAINRMSTHYSCAECGARVRHEEGFAIPHLAGFFRYCEGGGFPEKAEAASVGSLGSITRAREAAHTQWEMR